MPKDIEKPKPVETTTVPPTPPPPAEEHPVKPPIHP